MLGDIRHELAISAGCLGGTAWVQMAKSDTLPVSENELVKNKKPTSD
jgi:hypothetical protein